MHNFECAQDFSRDKKCWRDDEIPQFCGAVLMSFNWHRGLCWVLTNTRFNVRCMWLHKSGTKKKARDLKKELAWVCRCMLHTQNRMRLIELYGVWLIWRFFFFPSKFGDEVGGWSQRLTPSWQPLSILCHPKGQSVSQGECANEI